MKMKEKKNMSRREALRRIFSTAGLIGVSPSLMSFHNLLTGLHGESALPPDRFFINRIREALTGAGKPPVAPALLNRRSYDVYSLMNTGNPLLKGSICMNINNDMLSVEVVRFGVSSDHYSQFTSIEQKIRPDTIRSPISWRYQSYLAKTAQGIPYGTPLTGIGEYDGAGRIIITENSVSRTCHTSLPVTTNRNLLLAFERFAKDNLPFVLGIIDEYDLFVGERKIHPYGTAAIERDDKTVELHAVVMTGQGVLPTFYWSDDTGIPLFVNSGTEVYILSNPATCCFRPNVSVVGSPLP